MNNMTRYKTKKIHPSGNLEEPIFRLKVSETEKYKDDCRWFKEFVDYLVPYDTTVVDEYGKMKTAYDVINNDLSGFKEEFERFCSPMDEESKSSIKSEEILPYNKLHNKVNIFAGELLKRQDSHKIVLSSHQEIAEKNIAQREAIQRSLQERVALEIERVRMRYAGAKERELDDYMSTFRTQAEPEDLASKSFQTEWEIFNTKALKYCNYEQDLQAKKQLSIRHAITADRVFLYVGWEYGEPIIKVLNPLHCGFHKSPDVVYVEKGDYFWHKTAVTLADIYNEYIDILTEEEINSLGIYTYSSNLRVDKRHDVLSGKAKKVFDTTTEELYRHSQDVHDKTVGQSMANGTNRRYNNERLIWKTHIEFKAFREVVFLTFTDDMGYEVTEIISKGFDIPDRAEIIKKRNKFGNMSTFYTWTDDITSRTYTAERLWIPRRYEVTRLGQDVYVNCREVRNQPLDLLNPYKNFELSYKGRVFSNVNSISVSPVQRALPFQFQYFFVKHIQNRELAKYQGYTQDIDVDQIPDYLALDHNGDPIPGRDKVAVWRTYLKKLGVNFYSGSQSSDGLPPATRSPGSKSSLTGTAVDLINLGQMLELLDREIGMVMGISPQREANFTQGGNVTDNQNAIANSYNLTEPYYFMHSEVWKRALNDWLKLFRIYCHNIFESSSRKEHFINYVTPNGTSELLRITPDLIDHNDVGIYLSNSGQDQFYRESMVQLVHAFGQNAGEGMEVVSSLVKSISAGESPEEIHKLIQIESKKQQERLVQQQQAAEQSEIQRQQREIEWREDQQSHEVQLENIKGEYGLQEKAIDVYKFQDDLNKDQDGIPDPLEAAMAVHNMRKDMVEMGHKDRELAMKEAEVIDKRTQAARELAIKERETANKNNPSQ